MAEIFDHPHSRQDFSEERFGTADGEILIRVNDGIISASRALWMLEIVKLQLMGFVLDE